MFNTSEKIIVNNKEYQIINFLGKGKGGYSYLCKYNDNYSNVYDVKNHEKVKLEGDFNEYMN